MKSLTLCVKRRHVQNLKIYRRKKVILYIHLNNVALNSTEFFSEF